jgi:hypothetical protein
VFKASANADRPYLAAWLRRTRRQFSESGRLSQVALILASEEGGSPEFWKKRLSGILEHGEAPSLELLTKIDALLAGPALPPKPDREPPEQGSLW